MEINIINFPEEYKDIIYLAGRNCYGLEEFSDVLDDKLKKQFIFNIINKSHESVLEHCSISIYIKDVSRSFLAQITRHRLCSFSVKSQHFVKHIDFKYKLLESDILKMEYANLMQDINNFYINAINLGMPHYIAREVLPNACLTNIFMTANLREWRYIFKLRCPTNNTPEIREWALKTLKLFYEIMPEVFEDEVNEYVKLH